MDVGVERLQDGQAGVLHVVHDVVYVGKTRFIEAGPWVAESDQSYKPNKPTTPVGEVDKL